MTKEMSKKEILRALVEIWKKRNDPGRLIAAKKFLEAKFDPDLIEKHLDVQFRWSSGQAPSLDKNLPEYERYLQSGTLRLVFSTSGKYETGKATVFVIGFVPFTDYRGLTLDIDMYPERDNAGKEAHCFSLKGFKVTSITLKSIICSGWGAKTIAIFNVGGIGYPEEPALEIGVAKNEHDFDIRVSIATRVPTSSMLRAPLFYQHNGLLFAK